ncbi:Glyoxalase/bleomycin resistance protein/dioxygenase [Gloeomargarita lithophora Alchichica-D10]|uniref:Glyoxalase/bleomycin resistance protein/dioxygenase n=1 Tax=Gloeomargarita lithophora Alchichica-D10 TaxID=1188229 RepID=A0A1J0AE46_9CYAN|nr:VOC family protein [Gloeomargarita lithophora]APB34192.1 Glyoxalase/bleomycin resistance protein/dioxygenase [Gloeomargarita lithophora Alchichica-D10]
MFNSVQYHHIAIRTGNIHRAIEFYTALGFQVSERFTAGITLACWLEGLGMRLELMQVPLPRPAPDAFGDEHYVGYYHLSLQVTDVELFLAELSKKFSEPITVLLPPTVQVIGQKNYRVAFIQDYDGLPIELIETLDNPGGEPH